MHTRYKGKIIKRWLTSELQGTGLQTTVFELMIENEAVDAIPFD